MLRGLEGPAFVRPREEDDKKPADRRAFCWRGDSWRIAPRTLHHAGEGLLRGRSGSGAVLAAQLAHVAAMLATMLTAVMARFAAVMTRFATIVARFAHVMAHVGVGRGLHVLDGSRRRRGARGGCHGGGLRHAEGAQTGHDGHGSEKVLSVHGVCAKT